jgi:hypothetical protein
VHIALPLQFPPAGALFLDQSKADTQDLDRRGHRSYLALEVRERDLSQGPDQLALETEILSRGGGIRASA